MRPTLALATILGIVISLASPALAQGDAPKPASPPSGKGAGGQAPKVMPPISEDAKQHFLAGVSLLQDPEGERVEEAYREFKTAYDLSSSPKILGNMGFCAMRLERDGEAIEAYSTYLREVPDIDAEERAQIVRDLQTMTVGIVRLTLEVDKPGTRIVDVRVPVRGERVTNSYGPVQNGRIEIGVRPGHHLVTAKLDGHEDQTWEVEAYAASRDKHAFAMKPVRVATSGGGERKSGPILPWVIAGTGAAMMIGGTVTGVVALGKTSDLEKACPSDKCPKSFDLDGERSSARTFVRITDVLLIGGGVLVAGGLTWAILAGGSSEEKAARTPRPDLACGPTGCRATVGGAF